MVVGQQVLRTLMIRDNIPPYHNVSITFEKYDPNVVPRNKSSSPIRYTLSKYLRFNSKLVTNFKGNLHRTYRSLYIFQ